MKGKIGSSKKKKTIALIATLAVLLTGATAGVTLFLKDDGSASASEGQQQVGQLQEPEQNVEQIPNENQEDAEQENQENTENIQTEQDNNEEQTNIENNENNENVENAGNNENAQNAQSNETAIAPEQPQEFITYRDRLVAEDFLVGWTPIGISAIADTTGRFLNSPRLQIEKISYTETDYNINGNTVIPEEPRYTAVQSGETIIYEIRVSNVGLLNVNNIKITDKIPEGTTLESIDNMGIENNGNIDWIVDIPAGTQVSLKFVVTVNEGVRGNIRNFAVVNGDETNQTENPVIVTEKLAEITRNGKIVTEEARPGDIIKYTIKITNTGDTEATTIVTDLLPTDTSLVENSITDGGEEIDGVITWNDVIIEAGKEKEVSFSVIINEDAKSSIRNVATVGKTPTNETETEVANITGTKTVDKAEAKVGETLTYTITLNNIGNADGKVTVTDKIPEGTTIKDATVEEYDEKTNTMTWEDVEVKAGEEVKLTFEVVIDEETTTSVINTAILDEEEIPEKPETKVANITGTKTVDKAEAKVGETLTYTITLNNIGNADGKVTVTDKIPEGTTIKDATVDGYDEETNTMTWEDVEVKAGEEVKLIFEVVIDEGRTDSVINTAILDEEEIPEKPETKIANITAIKSSIADNPLKEMGTIEYKITLHNSGNVVGKVTVTDEVPEGTTLVPNSIKINETIADNITLDNNMITWADVEVGVTKDVVLSFKVKVNPFEEETKQIVNDKAKIDGNPINQTVDEAEKAYVDIEVSKVWNDNNNVAEKRPTSIKLQLKANEVNSGEPVTVTGSGNTWSYTFPDLAKYDRLGNEIAYTVEEIEAEENDLYFYEAKLTGNMTEGYTITNTFNVPDETVSVPVSKVWNDNNDEAKKRPTSIKLQLKANEVNSGEAVTVTGSGNTWSYTFLGLAKYDRLGNEIAYTVEEIEAEENDLYFYEAKLTGNMTEGYTITNTFNVPDETVSVPVSKVWNDNNDEAKKRPTSIELQLKAAGVLVRSKIVAENEDWSYKFTDLAKYDRFGNVINYTVEEVAVQENDLDFYEAKLTGDMTNGYTITNTFNVPNETVSVTVTKSWNDNDDKAKKRPLQLTLQVKNGDAIVAFQTVTENEEWSHTFTGLSKYDNKGNEINYTVDEAEVTVGDLKFYTKESIEGDMERGYTITNTFNVPDEEISITVNKQWDDDSNSAGKRPTSIKLQLKANDVNSGNPETVTGEGDTWSHTFESLPKYDEKGDEINYTVDEEEVKEGDLYFYTESINDNTITNTFYVPDDKVSVTVTKSWNDNDDEAEKRPSQLTLQVKNGDVIVDSHIVSGNTWSYTFKNLPKYDEKGDEINYTVEEAEVTVGDLKFYTKESTTGDMTNGYTITNKIIPIYIPKINKTIETIDGEEVGAGTTDVNINRYENVYVGLGTKVVYNIEVENLGNATLTNVTVTDCKDVTIIGYKELDDEEFKKVDNVKTTKGQNLLALALNNNEPSIEVGKGYVIQVEYTIKSLEDIADLTEFSNKAEISANGVKEESEAIVPVEISHGADIKKEILNKGGGNVETEDPYTLTYKNDTTKKDAILTYKITTENTGTTTIKDIEITDTKDVTLKSVKFSSKESYETLEDDVKVSKGVNLIQNGMKNTLAPGEKVEIVVTYEIEEVTENLVDNKATIVNTVYFSGTAVHPSEQGDDQPLEDEAIAKIDAYMKPDIEISKESDSTDVQKKPGENITYTITLTNNTPVDGTVYLQEEAPIGTEPVSATLFNEGEEILNTDKIGMMAKGELEITVPGNGTVTLKLVVKVKNKAISETVKNQASFTTSENSKPTYSEEISTPINQCMKMYTTTTNTILGKQSLVLVIDKTLSMASELNVTEDKEKNDDRLAYSYENTKWYSLKNALDDFIDDYFENSNGDKTISIVMFSAEATAMNDGEFYDNADDAKATYENIFTEDHFDALVEKAEQAGSKSAFNQMLLKAGAKRDDYKNGKGPFKTEYVNNGDDTYDIDVDALTYLVPECGLTSGTHVSNALEKAHEIVVGQIDNPQIDNSPYIKTDVVIITDGLLTRRR